MPDRQVLYTNETGFMQHLEVFGPHGNLGAVALAPGAELILSAERSLTGQKDYLGLLITTVDVEDDDA